MAQDIDIAQTQKQNRDRVTLDDHKAPFARFLDCAVHIAPLPYSFDVTTSSPRKPMSPNLTSG